MDGLARRSLDQIASAAALLLDVRLVLISVVDGPRQVVVGSYGLAHKHAHEPSPLCRDVATAGRPIILQDVRRRLPAHAHARGTCGFEIIGYAGVPLSVRHTTPRGALAALTSVRRAWQGDDLHVLRSLAAAAGAVLDMRAGCDERVDEERRGAADRLESASATGKRRTLELEKTSIHDELTGLLNRRGLFAAAPAQLEAIRRHSIGGFLLYIDLDGLKTANDRFGHAAGDDLLRSAATVLRSSFRDADTIARLGGDEFVVIATDTPPDEHPATLARLASELGCTNDQRDPAIPLAWSLGLVSIEPTAGDSLDILMSAADRRMYSAKRKARCDVAATPDGG